MFHRLLLPLCLLSAALPGRLPAQVVAYEPFNHSAPFQLNGSASSGVPWPTNSVWGPAFASGGNIVANSLAYGPLQTAGNKAQMPWFSGDNASIRSLGADRGGAPPHFWLSFLADLTQPNQGLYFYQGTTPQMLIGAPASGGGRLGMDLFAGVTGGATQTVMVSPPRTVDGTTHFYAALFQLGSPGFANTITLIVDPNPVALGTFPTPLGGSSVVYGALDFAFDSLVIGNFSGVTGTAGAFNLDEIRLGPTWASVSPVPEPSTLVLAGAVAVVAAVRRHRTPRGLTIPPNSVAGPLTETLCR